MVTSTVLDFGWWWEPLNSHWEHSVLTFCWYLVNVRIFWKLELSHELGCGIPLQPNVLAPFIFTILSLPLPTTLDHQRILILKGHLHPNHTLYSFKFGNAFSTGQMQISTVFFLFFYLNIWLGQSRHIHIKQILLGGVKYVDWNPLHSLVITLVMGAWTKHCFLNGLRNMK